MVNHSSLIRPHYLFQLRKSRKSQSLIVSRDEEGDVTNYLVMAKTQAEEKAVDKQPKKKNSVSKYPFTIVEKNYNRKSLEGKFQEKI